MPRCQSNPLPTSFRTFYRLQFGRQFREHSLQGHAVILQRIFLSGNGDGQHRMGIAYVRDRSAELRKLVKENIGQYCFPPRLFFLENKVSMATIKVTIQQFVFHRNSDSHESYRLPEESLLKVPSGRVKIANLSRRFFVTLSSRRRRRTLFPEMDSIENAKKKRENFFPYLRGMVGVTRRR